MATIEIRVPDIGDFKDVPIIEILVSVGETVTKEQSLITVESDKATMEIPSPESGVITSLVVKLGDVINAGVAIGSMEVAAAASGAAPVAAPAAQPLATPVEPPPAAATAAPASTSAPSPAKAVPQGDLHAEVLVLGAGPGGYTAAFRLADLGKKVVLVER